MSIVRRSPPQAPAAWQRSMRTNIWTSSTPRTSAEVPLRVVDSLESVPAQAWNALLESGGNPFVRHEFLFALERAGCVGRGTGWTPHHLLLQTASGEIEAALPLYSKGDSWGEFVFDWSWARAYSQAGLRYYPKLVSMAPFTPATGPRLLAKTPDAREQLATALLEYARAEQVSSAHLLFVTETDRGALGSRDFL